MKNKKKYSYDRGAVQIGKAHYDRLKEYCKRPDVRRNMKEQVEMMIETLPMAGKGK